MTLTPCLPAAPAASQALFSPKDTKAILSVSHATLYRLIKSGRLDARKIAGKTVITRESIESFISLLPRVGQ